MIDALGRSHPSQDGPHHFVHFMPIVSASPLAVLLIWYPPSYKLQPDTRNLQEESQTDCIVPSEAFQR